MPLYYFHVMDGRVLIDSEGTELMDVDAVRKEAVRTAGEILAGGAAHGVLNGVPWNMTVADETGKTVYSLCFSAREYD